LILSLCSKPLESAPTRKLRSALKQPGSARKSASPSLVIAECPATTSFALQNIQQNSIYMG
jgi:hypothetical protein